MSRTLAIFSGFLTGWCVLLAAASAGASELTTALVESRLEALAKGGAGETDEVVQAYESVRDWLRKAEGFDEKAARYAESLTSAPRREAEIQARIDALEPDEDVVARVAELSPEEREAQLTAVRTELREASNALDALDKRLEAPEMSATGIRLRLEEIGERLAVIGSPDASFDPAGTPSLGEARRWNEVAERAALLAERDAEEARLESQPARYSALQVERVELALRVDRLTARRDVLESSVRSEGPAAALSEAAEIPPDDPAYPVASAFAEETAGLAEQRQQVAASLDGLRGRLEKVETAMSGLDDRFATARRMVEFAADSDALGDLLLAYWEEIGTFQVKEVEDSIRDAPQRVGNAVISRIGHEEMLAGLVNARTHVQQRLEEANVDPATVSDASRDALVAMATGKRELLRSLMELESEQISALAELEAGYRGLQTSIAEYETYLSRRILWVRNRAPLWREDPRAIVDELRQLAAEGRALVVRIRPSFGLLLLLAVGLRVWRGRLRALQRAQGAHLGSARHDSILFTVTALVLSVLRALPLPLVAWALATLPVAGGSALAPALSAMLRALGVALFTLIAARILCEDGGVGRRHFGWSTATCARAREEAGWLLRWWVPAAALASLGFRVGDSAALLDRLFMLAALLLPLGHFLVELRRERRSDPERWLTTLPNRMRAGLVVILALLVVALIWGLHFSVGAGARSLLMTLAGALGLVVLYSFLRRWLQLVRRRLRLEELETARAARQAEGAHLEEGALEEEETSVVELGEETTQLLQVTTGATAILVLLAIWAPVLPAVTALSGITLWRSTQVVGDETVTTQITLMTLLVVGLLVAVTLYAARKLPALVELILRTRSEMTAAARYTVTTLLTYVIVGGGILAALSSLGLRWSQLQWLVAALGVGIGFGLQEIIANFISGLIILFERPIRVGDTVTVGEQDGIVTKIRIRATTIRDWDGKELLVPNKEFITGRLLNWTLSDPQIRVIVTVGIAYGSDVVRALQIVREVARDDPDVLSDPEPSVIFSAFGDNSLELKARVFLHSADQRWIVMSRMHERIYARLAEAGIVIAFPQRDVHFDADKPLRIALDKPAAD